jgi:hypothetical protein
MVRHRDRHRVDVGLIEQIVVVGVSAGDFEPVGGFLEPFGVRFRDCDGGCAGTMQKAVEMIVAETTGSNYRATKSFGHRMWWNWLLVVADALEFFVGVSFCRVNREMVLQPDFGCRHGRFRQSSENTTENRHDVQPPCLQIVAARLEADFVQFQAGHARDNR